MKDPKVGERVRMKRGMRDEGEIVQRFTDGRVSGAKGYRLLSWYGRADLVGRLPG